MKLMTPALRTVYGVGLLTSPILLTTALLYAPVLIPGSPVGFDYITLAATILATLAGLWLLPISRIKRWIWTPIVLVVAPFVSVGWAFGFACSAFGSCL